jgi:general stress protein 26
MSTNEGLRNEVTGRFAETQVAHLATIDGDQPRLRPVTLIHLNGRFYVATGTEDAKVEQLRENPRAEFCILLDEGDDQGSLRAECTTRVVEAPRVRKEVYDRVSFLKQFWETPDDPSYVLIELKPSAYQYMKPGTTKAINVKA